MALMITDECNGCSACEPECPNTAIAEVDGMFVIDPDKCTECVGHFDESQCTLVCPIACIVADPKRQESRSELSDKFQRLSEQPG